MKVRIKGEKEFVLLAGCDPNGSSSAIPVPSICRDCDMERKKECQKRGMKTSNFKRNGRSPKAVAISRGVPKWYKGRRYLKLAPSWELIKIKDPQKFIKLYYRYILDHLDPQEVYKELGADAILLCWEKPGEFCHRRVVARWLEEKLGIEVPEL